MIDHIVKLCPLITLADSFSMPQPMLHSICLSVHAPRAEIVHFRPTVGIKHEQESPHWKSNPLVNVTLLPIDVAETALT